VSAAGDEPPEPGAVLGIDPGMRKCGFAVVTLAGVAPAELGIVPTAELAARLREVAGRHRIRTVALGSGTHPAAVASLIAGLGLPWRVVDERETTLLARKRYFAAHPPGGWRRLVPLGMLLPPRPIDDFAAVLIAERFLGSEAGTETGSEAPPGPRIPPGGR
jgi:RNase H-fold protein (predicted Holliday junction resolvase)